MTACWESATGMLMPVGGGDPVELTPQVTNGYVVSFSTRLVLPLGARYATRIIGTDFAGIGATENIDVATLDDFGVIADGFESGTTTESVTVGDYPVGIGELQHLVVTLPAAGTDVLVYFRGDDYSGAGCMRTGLLLDDMRLE